MSAFNIKARKKSRKLALQAIYQWQLTNDDLNQLQAQFLAHPDNQECDRDYFKLIVSSVVNQASKLDETFKPFLDRDLNDIGPVELAVLRMGTYELLSCPEIPYKVILNEAIELTKIFGAKESHKYINSILDKVSNNIVGRISER